MIEFDRNFFKSIDSPEKSYILGFFYADGNNSGRQISFDQLEQDEDILEHIRKALKAENNIKVKRIQENQRKLKNITFSSVELCEDLEKLGGIKNKSLVLNFPTSSIVPDYLLNHFIRGYFDGDGCIWNGKRKKMIVKDTSRPEGFRERIVHNVKFTFTGNYEFINSLQDKLVELKIVNKKTKLNFSKAKNQNNNTSS